MHAFIKQCIHSLLNNGNNNSFVMVGRQMHTYMVKPKLGSHKLITISFKEIVNYMNCSIQTAWFLQKLAQLQVIN